MLSSRFTPLRIAGAACLLLASQAMAQGAEPAPAPETEAAAQVAVTPGDGRHGTFKTVQGDVTVVRGSVHVAAVVGDPLHATDRVLTGGQSTAAMVLKDGTVLSVGPDSVLDLSEFSFDSTTHEGNVLVALARGSLRMVTGLIAKLKPEQVRVTTPTTVIGVRGTDFIVEQRP